MATTKTSPGQFLSQVKTEVGKVTWPTRREAGISLVMVLVMVFLSALFFFVVDQLMALGVKLVFGLGG